MADKFDNASNLVRRSGVSFLANSASILSVGAIASLAYAPRAVALCDPLFPDQTICTERNVNWAELEDPDFPDSPAVPIFNGGTLNFVDYQFKIFPWYGEYTDGLFEPSAYFEGYPGAFEINAKPWFDFLPETYKNTIDNSGNKVTFSGRLFGAGDMIFTGNGHTKLFGSNEFTGQTIIKEGKLVIENPNASPSGLITIEKGAQLILNGND